MLCCGCHLYLYLCSGWCCPAFPPLTLSLPQVLLACLAAVAVAAPQFNDGRPIVLVLRDDRQDNGDGNFNFGFEADNGIAEERSGTPGLEGQSNMQGSFRFPLPDGTFAEVRYVADEGGFRPESPLLPTPHPLPAHAIEQIRIAEEQRARGEIFQ
ncbi:Cuticle protein AM1159 [Portunus trituberculatus]|uniref:Cuticle protein AM1159 n=1 Tax=Portunus trituberculatus TaxID=210409 RepID=A0A5B7IG73_PORTR|nr:Cuticle protein AM1159 [Portunus trituberculatus]